MYPQTTPIMDFDIVDTHNSMTIAIADTSVYPTGFSIVSPTLQIIPPGFPIVTMDYTPNAMVFLNSNQLNITCVTDTAFLTPLPDGIWQVNLSVYPSINYTTSKTFLRTLNIQRTLGNAFLKTNLKQCDMNVRIEQMKVIDEIYYYLQAAIAAANQCNSVLAMNLYQTANTMLENFINGNCKGKRQTLYC